MDVDESAEGAVPDLDRGHDTPFCVIVVRAKAGCFRVRISFNVIQNQPDRPKLGRNISKMVILLHTYNMPHISSHNKEL